jgi:hypothetical protein
MNVFLTIDLEIGDKVFDDFSGFYKASINTIIEKCNYDMLVDNYQIKFKYLVQEIIKLNKDVLVGNVCYNLEDLKLIIALFNESNLEIQKVFIPSVSRRILTLLEGQKLYRDHNRWIYFYPGQIEDVHEKKENNYLEILKYFENSKIKIIEI